METDRARMHPMSGVALETVDIGRWGWSHRVAAATFGSNHLMLAVGAAALVRLFGALLQALGLPDGIAGTVAALAFAAMLIAMPAFGALGEGREVSLITATAGADAGSGYPPLPLRARLVVGALAGSLALLLLLWLFFVDGETADDVTAFGAALLFSGIQLRLVLWQVARWVRRR